MKSVLLLGAQHGNELLGDMLRQYVNRKARHLLPFITYKTANLRARRAGVRYIDSDMNRSYRLDNKNNYEVRRAKHISSYIESKNFDIVLDLHTTNCRQPACILTNGLTDEKRSFLRSSSTEKVIDMQHEIVRNSLIGVHDNALSIEISNEELGIPLLERLVMDIERYIAGDSAPAIKELYIVNELLLKSSVTDGTEFENFAMSPFGFIPILTGETAYKKHTNYLGFRSDEVTQIKV